jgi:hypothetical protein
MDSVFSHLTLTDVHHDVVRNIVSVRSGQNLFDDLTDSLQERELAQRTADSVNAPRHQSRTSLIHSPFEDAQWFTAIGFPFRNWQASRFSDGSFGVWYGCGSLQTTVLETAYHWLNGLLSDAGFDKSIVVGERAVYDIACDAALLDLRPLLAKHSALTHKTDYRVAQSVGARVHREGHPGLLTASVRHAKGCNYVVFNPGVLSNPRLRCHLTYRLDGNWIFVEKHPGDVWMKIEAAAL